MILTNYYAFEKKQPAKTRIDCIKSVRGYSPFENLRSKDGKLFLYLGDNTYIKGHSNTKADLVLSKSKHISSIYKPNNTLNYAFGDMNGTNDAFLFILHNIAIKNGELQDGTKLELFTAEGQRFNRNALYNMLCNGDLDKEINALRENAVIEE